MKKIKLIFSVLSRANYARVKSVIKKAIESEIIEPIVVVGCSALSNDYGNIIEECDRENIVIHEKISSLMHEKTRENMVKTTALGMLDFSNILSKYKPDIGLTVADRYETISFAIACSYMRIPLIHLQGGEPTGCIDDKVRNAITQLSDYHFVCSKDAYSRILKWGEPKNRIFNVGCPSLDHINFKNDNQIKECLEILNLKYKTNINTKKEYLVFLYHPDTNKYFQEFNVVLEPLIVASKKLKANIVIIQPNADAGSTEIVESLNILKNQNTKEGKFNDLNIDYLNHLTSSEYITLLQGCKVLVGNSSSGIREGSFLGISVVNIGERQSFRLKPENVYNVELNSKGILNTIIKAFKRKSIKRYFDYGDGNSASKIINIIEKLEISIKSTKL